MGAGAHVLVVDAVATEAQAVADVLTRAGVSCITATDGASAWRAMAANRPRVVLLDLAAREAEVFLRRLRDEFMGAPPRMVALATRAILESDLSELGIDIAIERPATDQALLKVGTLGATGTIPVALDPSRMTELIGMTCIGGELQERLDGLSHRLSLLYGVDDCTVIARVGERQWMGTVGRAPDVEAWPRLWDDIARAVNAGAPLIVGMDAPMPGATRFAAPLTTMAGAVVGAICLTVNEPRLFAPDAREALTDLGARLGTELQWRSVHERVAAERDLLRENAMLDPLLGILSPTALDQALSTEQGRARRTSDPLTVAVIDVSGLRLVNDRYGHLAGDAALRHVATVVRETLRAQDVVGRYGGDEIAVLLAATSVPGATTLLRRLIEAVETTPFDTPEGHSITVAVTAGVATCGADDDGLEVLGRASRAASSGQRLEAGIVVADAASSRAQTHRSLALVRADRYEAGVTLGGVYQIVHEISRGAMGVVYRAEDLGLARPVAIKMLRPDLVADPEATARFREEAATLAALHHENLVKVYALGEEGSNAYFVMELVEGVSLDDVIDEHEARGEWVPNGRVADIAVQIAGALDAMHDAGLLHRDVKPGNVLLDRARDRAVLVDVGLARQFGAESEPSGTPGFIAPETVTGGEETPATDVYGLAATLYTALLARLPFGHDEDYHVVVRRQLSNKLDPPTSIRPDLSPEIDEILLSAMAVDPKERPTSAGALATAFRFALASESTRAPAVVAGRLAVGKPARSQRLDSTKPFGVPVIPSDLSSTDVAVSRGALFRAAPRVLGMAALKTWFAEVVRRNRPLVEALSPRTQPTGWVSSSLYHELIDEVAASGRDPDEFAAELALLSVADTFRTFYPSSLASLTPRSTLAALDVLWRRYHSWGGFYVQLNAGADSARIALHGMPERAGVCSFAGGFLAQVLAFSGATSPDVQQVKCALVDNAACTFIARWPSAPPAQDRG